jgi:hypothetical protein
MAAPITLTLTPKSAALLKALKKGKAPKEVFKAVFDLFDKQAKVLAGRVVSSALSGQLVNRRSGELARSIIGKAEIIGGLPSIRVGIFRGPALRYAGVQEYGTKGKNPESPYDTIRPKNAKALAIPLDPVLTPAGVPKISGPRAYKEAFGVDLRFVPFRNSGIAIGALYPANKFKKNGDFFANAKAAYLLLRQADIEPKHYMKKTLTKYLPTIARELAALLKDLLNGKK